MVFNKNSTTEHEKSLIDVIFKFRNVIVVSDDVTQFYYWTAFLFESLPRVGMSLRIKLKSKQVRQVTHYFFVNKIGAAQLKYPESLLPSWFYARKNRTYIDDTY